MSEIGTQKRLVSTFTSKLDRIISELEEAKMDDMSREPPSSPNELKELIRKIEEGHCCLTNASSKVEKQLSSYAVTVDALEPPSRKEVDAYEEYAGKAESAISRAFDIGNLLQARLLSLRTQMASVSLAPAPVGQQAYLTKIDTKPLELPPLPIPSFAGNLWEWENFWELYNANIHSQDLPEMVKYNYLLSALKGQAKESIKKFQLTKENYDKVVQFLLKKYNNRDLLVNQLVEKLERCALKSPSVEDQRSLLEEIQAIVAQLKDKGENVDSSWLTRKVLSKFPTKVMRKVIARKQRTSEDSFKMHDLIQYLEDYLSTEEMCTAYIGARTTNHQASRIESIPKTTTKKTCMYCKGEHASFLCTVFPSPQARSQYLRQNQLCLLCASPAHKTLQCKRRFCFYCKAAHHSSCCLSRQNGRTEATVRRQEHPNAENKPPEKPKKDNKVHVSVNSSQRATTNDQSTNSIDVANHNAVLQLRAMLHTKNNSSSLLPTGEITVLDPKTKTLRKIDILFDSGAEVSFIDISLAKELDLPVVKEERIKIHTFGSKEVRQATCKLVQLNMWDAEGKIHKLQLRTHGVLTRPFPAPRVPDMDRQAINAMKMSVQSLNSGKEVINPLILLGCDQMWTLLRTDISPTPLPSGLMLIPTKLGYIISGQSRANPDEDEEEEDPHQVLQVSPLMEESEKWDGYWSMDVHVNTICTNDSQTSETEQEKWENYWTMDAAGTEQFMGSMKEVRESQDKMVWEQFNKTIERRDDGYYVRLPWKEQYPHLPDNYAIAFKRLVNVWTSLQKDEALLEKYNNVFQEQLQKNIVEVVENNSPVAGNQIHYIPHQPVFTPQKTITKLRIVFDASAHFKGSPSLNDVLHRGPVILPSLYGLLLRFRVGAIALISDVEKAFLQIRLHELDRDATRCLWLLDHKKPPEKGNILILRFTRVTFGIKSSPFLLAGTTRYHLDTHIEDSVSQEIKNNIYVDNLILTSDTYQESVQFYKKSKRIFNELGMNLREFASNNPRVLEAIDEVDKAETCSLKVLGVQWDRQTDTLDLSCLFPESSTATKRSVTSAIASIYDPLGWFVPLLHPARVFLRRLWKEQYDWDTKLSTDRTNEWRKVVDQAHGFRKTLPRFMTAKTSEAIIVTFADASTSGMTACAYLLLPQLLSTHLLMGRSKLPSMKGQSTIPKLELNAVTLAMRLSNAIASQLKMVLNIHTIYVFSDSEIVLSWIKQKPQREVGIFVHNRLTEIHQIAEHLMSEGVHIKLGYVTTEDNPADCGTRGLTASELQNHFWWTGPWFLKQHRHHWPYQDRMFDVSQDATGEKSNESVEETPDQTILSATASVSTLCSDNSEIIRHGHARTLTQAKRILAHALRFVHSLVLSINEKGCMKLNVAALQDTTVSRETPYLNGRELEFARRILIKHHQRVRIGSNITRSLKLLNIRSDAEGVLRCYGRLGQAQMHSGTKYPIFVLQKTNLAEWIIHDVHDRGHPGVNHTMALVRQEFWIPQLRSQVARIVRKCIQCQKFNNLPYQYPNQDDLPRERVVRSYPFNHIGLDYFGPLTISLANGEQGKCFGSIITCMVTRLVHLDVVTDLSTAAFLQMLRRFFARRGLPKTIISDNASTFLLGESIIRDCFQAELNNPTTAKELSNRGIEWKHITPFAPWQGGFYERLIKSIKQTLYKTLGGSIVTLEEMSTTIIEIEAIINTRPLTYLGNEMDSMEVLRPIDFLQKNIEIRFPLLNLKDEQDEDDYLPSAEIPSLVTRHQAIAALQTSCKNTEKFWQLWQTQYLTSLREKHTLTVGTKRSSTRSPREGNLVLVSDPILPRQNWKVGVIDKLTTSSRGKIREALVRLPSRRTIRRPINLLIPLELEDSTTPSGDEDQHTGNIVEEEKDGVKASTMTNPSPRYNLRPREKTSYNECENEQTNDEQRSSSISTMLLATSLLQTLVLCILCSASFAITTSKYSKSSAVQAIIQYNIFLPAPTPANRRNYNEIHMSEINNISHCTYSIIIEVNILDNQCILQKSISLKRFPPLQDLAIMSHKGRQQGNEYRESFIFLSTLYREALSADILEKEMEATLKEINAHVKMADTLDSQLMHHVLTTTCSNFTGGELAMSSARLWKTATYAKEKLVSFTQKYMMLDSIYRILVDNEKILAKRRVEWSENQEHNARRIAARIQEHLTRLDRNISDIEHELTQAEKKIQDEKVENKEQFVSAFNKAVGRLEGKLEEIVCKLKADIQSNEKSPPVKRKLEDEAEEGPSTRKNRELSDDDYMDKLIAENRDNQEDAKVDDQERTKQYLEHLERTLDALYRGRILLPHRKIGEAPSDTTYVKCAFCGQYGAHFSDSCPTIANGEDRFMFIIQENLCQFCLKDNHRSNECRAVEKNCWYCDKVRGTALEFLIYDDGGHHRALCNIPDSKDRVSERIKEVKEEINNIKYQ